MAQAGIHALIGLQSKRLIPHEKGLYPSIIIGSLLPDLDIILVAISSMFYSIEKSTEIFHRTFSHSFFSLIIMYLIFMILGEAKKNSQLKAIGKGLTIGILLHIIVDTFLWFHGVHFLWPLPVSEFNLWESIHLPVIMRNLILSCEFLFFRIYAWFLINQYIANPVDHDWFIKFLSQWMKIESILFVIFLFFTYFEIPSFTFLFGLAYIPSLIMAIISTILMWHSIEPTQKEQI
ncbi:MAG: metal-dependent hydrolase [Candidatus Marinimicrobia bacterium]|nr:metal-dependent hydrolase [Candidatus Neomarinimicrobiota bacterium]